MYYFIAPTAAIGCCAGRLGAHVRLPKCAELVLLMLCSPLLKASRNWLGMIACLRRTRPACGMPVAQLMHLQHAM